jgi:hypothetical protein
MANATTTAVSVPPFGVEADGLRNNDLLLQSIPNGRLRSAISASKGTVVNTQCPENTPVIPEGQAMFLGALPPIPGMQIHVNPQDGRYKIVDPIHGNKTFCKRLEKALEAKNVVFRDLDGVPTKDGTLDEDSMKTLCRELIWLLDAREAKLVKGPRPSIEDVDEMPGRYLLNPGSRIPTGQPRYEDELSTYVADLRRVGG